MTFPTYDIAKEYLTQMPFVDYDHSFRLARLASQLLRYREDERLGRDLVIRVKDAFFNNRIDKNTLPIWNDLLIAAGLFPYADPETLDKSSLLSLEYHRSSYMKDYLLHQEQMEVSMALRKSQPVILSAPTSYGKSLLIEEIVASRKYNCIVIIQPTLALLDETRKKLQKYKADYRILVSTSQLPQEGKRSIFLFTGERVVEYEYFPPIDFFVIDEFYKLSMDRDDDRAVVLNQALYKLMKHTHNFYMLGPMIKDIPENIKEKLNIQWTRTDFATVAVDERMVISKGSVKGKEQKQQRLFEELNTLKDPTLIYVSSPAKCTELSINFVKYNNQRRKAKVPKEIAEICDWIKENIHGKWGLIDALENGVAFHHGALPRHLGSSIVDAFNNGHIKYLFCTATLIEGVNTSAKNVVLFDKKKGTKDIDYFDYKNIAGRSGRMRQHFIGNVIRFEKAPQQMEFEVDIPILTQENAPLEILLAIDEQDINPSIRSKLAFFKQLPSELQQVLKKHSSVNIGGQLALIDELERNLSTHHRLLSWTNTPPSFDHLAAVIGLAWDYLANREEKMMRIQDIGGISARWLTSFTYTYYRTKSIGATIADCIDNDFWKKKIPDLQTRINTASFSILQVSRTWFDYKLPKWITIVQDLQEYVFNSHRLHPGNYKAVATGMENGFLSPELAALREYDIPITAIRKLLKYLNTVNSPEQNLARLSRIPNETLIQLKLLPYEIKKLKAAF